MKKRLFLGLSLVTACALTPGIQAAEFLKSDTGKAMQAGALLGAGIGLVKCAYRYFCLQNEQRNLAVDIANVGALKNQEYYYPSTRFWYQLFSYASVHNKDTWKAELRARQEHNQTVLNTPVKNVCMQMAISTALGAFGGATFIGGLNLYNSSQHEHVMQYGPENSAQAARVARAFFGLDKNQRTQVAALGGGIAAGLFS